MATDMREGWQVMHNPRTFDYTKTYYLSGPMAGYPEHNFPAFAEAEGGCEAAGIKVLSPHKIIHAEPVEGEVGNLPWEEYLRKDLEVMLAECQGLILLKGWPQSKGARLELTTALSIGWPVYYLDNWMLHDMNRSS